MDEAEVAGEALGEGVGRDDRLVGVFAQQVSDIAPAGLSLDGFEDCASLGAARNLD